MKKACIIISMIVTAIILFLPFLGYLCERLGLDDIVRDEDYDLYI